MRCSCCATPSATTAGTRPGRTAPPGCVAIPSPAARSWSPRLLRHPTPCHLHPLHHRRLRAHPPRTPGVATAFPCLRKSDAHPLAACVALPAILGHSVQRPDALPEESSIMQHTQRLPPLLRALRLLSL